MSFVQRQIDITITLAAQPGGPPVASFTSAPGNNQSKYLGLRISASIVKGTIPAGESADIRIWGMTKSDMADVSYLGVPLNFVRKNVIKVSAGDTTSGMATVFEGIIIEASQEFNDAPNVCLTLSANAGGLSQVTPVPAFSTSTVTSVVSLVTTVAASMSPPLTVENNGVTGSLPPSYFSGTASDQINTIKKAANIEATPDGNILAIWPKDGARGTQVVTISAASGLVGYPVVASQALSLRSIYFPGVRVGGNINLISSVTSGHGPLPTTWTVYGLVYSLESQSPDGDWFMDMDARLPGGGVAQGNSP